MLEENIKKRLSSFSKAELIYGIMFLGTCDIDLLIARANEKKVQTEQDKKDKQWNEYTRAFEDFKKYLKELSNKYGDGNSVKYGNLPSDKFDKLCSLHSAMLEAAKRLKRIIRISARS